MDKKCCNCMRYTPYGFLNARYGMCNCSDENEDKIIWVKGGDTCENWKSLDCREAKYLRFLKDFFKDWNFTKWGDIPPVMMQRAEDAFNKLSEEEMECL